MQRAVKRAQKYWMKEEVKTWYSARNNVSAHRKYIHTELCYKCHPIEYQVICYQAHEDAKSIVHKQYIHQRKKLEQLLADTTRNPRSRERNGNSGTTGRKPTTVRKFRPRIVNLSNSALCKEELALLEKGLKYAQGVIQTS